MLQQKLESVAKELATHSCAQESGVREATASREAVVVWLDRAAEGVEQLTKEVHRLHSELMDAKRNHSERVRATEQSWVEQHQCTQQRAERGLVAARDNVVREV